MKYRGFMRALSRTIINDLDCHCGMPAIGPASKYWNVPNKRRRCELHAAQLYKGDFENGSVRAAS